MGNADTDFDLTAAKFDASAGYSFANMPKLETVDVPRTFSGATIPAYTFYNDTELRLANIDYKITLIGDGAFSEDNKLESIFIWGEDLLRTEPPLHPSESTYGTCSAGCGHRLNQ